MIFGSEGLPRSGKSLEAMQHVADSLNAGRTVVTNIHGMNHQAISEYLVLPLPTVQRLLICLVPPKELDEDQAVKWVKEQFLAHVKTDSLWIWDEINQFWPPDRQPLPAEWAKFVTEHGHLGIDILIMGQDLTELHKTWRGRLQRYTRYTKLDMMGKEDSFHWASFSNAGRNKFRKTADGKKPYNKSFFVFYSSHRADTVNKGNYKDKRYGVFQAKHKFYAFLLICALLVAFYMIWGFFHPQPVKPPVAETPATSSVVAPVKAAFSTTSFVPAGSGDHGGPQPAADHKSEDVKPPIDYFDKLASKYDLRLSAILERKPYDGDTRPWLAFQVDVLDGSYRVKERFDRESLVALGWAVERTGYGIKLSKSGVEYVVRAWPLDNFGKVPKQAIADLKPAT